MNQFFETIAQSCNEMDHTPGSSMSRQGSVAPPQAISFHHCKKKSWNSSRPVRTSFFSGIMPQEAESFAYKQHVERMLHESKKTSAQLISGFKLRKHVGHKDNSCKGETWLNNNPCFQNNMIKDFTTQNTLFS